MSIGSFSQERVSLSAYLNQLDSTTNLTFFFKDQWIAPISIETTESADYIGLIKSTISAYGLNLYIHEETNVFIYPNPVELERSQKSASVTGNLRASHIVRIGNALDSDRNKVYQLRGKLVDESNGLLSGVNIQVDNELVAKTDENGNYVLDLKPGNYLVTFSYVGKESEKRFITLFSSGNLDVPLFADSELLDEVIVEGSELGRASEIGTVGAQKLSVNKLEKLPSFLGDVDVVKSTIALPGVTVSGESSSYLNVRGGRNDQTLVLMNGTTVYNPGHMLGFFSVFNGDFVSEVTLFKGNIPARYGMRSSSVLDVKMNRWANKKLNVYGGIGLASSNVGVKSKHFNNKLDLHIGGRLSYVDWILDLVPDRDIAGSTARYEDLNFNSRFSVNEKNQLLFMSYYGNDFFNYSDDVIYKWQTINNSLKWTRILNDDWILESSLLTSRLNNSSESLLVNDEFLFTNGISELAFTSLLSSSQLEAGIDVNRYSIEIGEIEPTEENSLVRTQSFDEENLLNVGVHASYRIPLTDKLEIHPGLRFNYFMNYGPSSVNQYATGQPYTPENVIGVREYASGEIISSQKVLEPRVGVSYTHGANTLRLGYSRVNQFLHMISNTVLVNPSTVWKGSDSYIPRSIIDQYSVGYQYDIEKYDLSFSVDGFYKMTKNALDYRDAAVLVANGDLEQEILLGEGTTYGVEFLASKNKGSLTGFLSYTFSRAFIEVDDEVQGIQINSGDRYPYYSDRPHSVKANVDYKMSKKWTLSSNFTYISGAPISAPFSVFEIEGTQVPFFTDRNSGRIPDYHRLDLVVTWKNRIRKTKKNNDRWVLTLYNVYGRDNIATIFFANRNGRPSQAFKLINVGRMVPTLTYKFEF